MCVLLKDRDIRDPIFNALQQIFPKVLVFHLAAPEHNGKPNFVALFKKLAHVINLDIQVMDADLRPNAQLFDLAALVLLSGFFQLLLTLVTVFGEVCQFANWRIVLRRDLNEVQTTVLRETQGFFNGFYA